MRGLKLTIEQKRIITSVASFTDAWIETVTEVSDKILGQVASFTDAWIETFTHPMEGLYGLSHLLQMRGLKRDK